MTIDAVSSVPAVVRREDERLLTGGGRFTGDLRRPGMVHAAFLRSPHAHATMAAVDVGAARAAPGVVAVFAAADLAAAGFPDLPSSTELKRPDGAKAPSTPRPLLARERVRHVGEPVALVIAESATAAADAAELIAVDYAALPGVAGIADALAAGAPSVWPEAPGNVGFLWQHGDRDAVAAAIAGAAHVTRLDFRISRVAANPLEPRSALGLVADDGRLELHASNQAPYELRNQLARNMFKLEPQQLHVLAGDVGGSFGMKSGVHVEDALVLWAARRLGRPVRWVSDRGEAFQSDDHARDMMVHGALALDRDGRFVALALRFDINVGAYLSGRSLGLLNNMGGIAGVYATPLILAEARGIFSHTVTTAPYRGAGRPEATFAIERLIDVAARETGIEPWELRRRNLIPASAMPFKTGCTFTYDCGDFAANMEAAARLADLDGFARRRDESKARGRLRGLGIANPVEVAGGPFGRPGKDYTAIRVLADGSVSLDTGTMSTGQGLETAFAQLVAARLGLPIERVRYAQGDSDQLPGGRGNGGSSSITTGGSSVHLTLEKVIEKGRLIAAEALEAAPADIVFADGRFAIAGTDRSIGLVEVARIAEDPARLPEGMAPGLGGSGEFQPAQGTYPNGCHVCEVEIDPETGQVELQRYCAVEDVGRVINGVLLRGQLHGGIAMGVGQALGEEIVHESGSAQLLSASFMDYQMPRATDFPDLVLETREVPTALNPLGVKGVGEAGTVGALAATVNAVCDALAPLGIVHFDMPATPARVWAAIRGRKLGS